MTEEKAKPMFVVPTVTLPPVEFPPLELEDLPQAILDLAVDEINYRQVNMAFVDTANLGILAKVVKGSNEKVRTTVAKTVYADLYVAKELARYKRDMQLAYVDALKAKQRQVETSHWWLKSRIATSGEANE